MPDASGLVKKTGYDAKMLDIEKKNFTASDYNKFTKEILHAKIKETDLVDKSYISNLVKSSDLTQNMEH